MRLRVERVVVPPTFALLFVTFVGCSASTSVDERMPCGGGIVPSAAVGPADTTIALGGQFRLTATLRCGSTGSALVTTWTWTSSRPELVSVDATGLVTAIARGVATVSATSSRYAASSATATVRSFQKMDVGQPTIEPASLILKPGEYAQMRAVLGANSRIEWSTSDTSVATIDPNGLLRAIRCGTLGSTIVTARRMDDPTISAAAALTVRELAYAKVSVQFIRDSTTGEPVDFGHVRGTLTVRVDVDERLLECGLAKRLELSLSSSTSSESITQDVPSLPATAADIHFATTARRLGGQHRTPNGTYSLIVRALDASGALVEATPAIAVKIDNP